MKKVKDMCLISGLTKRTLQYYDDTGLIHAKRSEQNYRVYDDNDLQRLWEILLYKEAGFELKEIRQLLNSQKNQYEEILNTKINTLSAKLTALNTQLQILKSFSEHGLPLRSSEDNCTYIDSINMLRIKFTSKPNAF